MDDSIHYRFVNELRYVEIALLRGQFIFADIALGNARQLLMAAETVIEGKKLHQLKAYDTLDKQFLTRLETTYSASRDFKDMHIAKEDLLALYLDTVHRCGFLEMDSSVLKLLGCFD